MNDWQIKEYDELRLEKIAQEHINYLYNRASYIVEKMFFENIVEQPAYSGWRINIVSLNFKDGVVEAGVEYMDNCHGELYEDFYFAAEWLSMSEDNVLSEIMKKQMDAYSENLRVQENLRKLKKERDIKDLEDKLKKLKGEGK